MGTSASVPLDIEAFRPQPPPDLPVQPDGYSATAAGIPANAAASQGRAAGTAGASAAAAAAAAGAPPPPPPPPPPPESLSAVAAGGGGGEGNSGHSQGATGGQAPFEAGGDEAPFTAGCVAPPTNPTVNGKRSRATSAVDGGTSISTRAGTEDEPPRKRTAWQPQADGRAGVAPSELPEPGTPDASGIDVGDTSPPAPNTPDARPYAAGALTADFNAINGFPTTSPAENSALAALAGIVTNPIAMMIEPPQRGIAAGARAPALQPTGNTEALAVASPPPVASGGGGAPQSQCFGVPPIDVGMESGESGHGARPPPPPPPPPPRPVLAQMQERAREIVDGAATGGIPHVSSDRFHQAPSLTQHTHAVPSLPAAAAAAFGATVGPQAAPVGGVASHLGAGRGLVSVAAAGGSSDAAQRHRPPLVPPLLAGPAGGGMGAASGGGGAPRPKRKWSGPAAGRRQDRRKCGKEGCKRRPTFGVEGTRLAQFCASHKPEGFVNVLCKRCDVEGCKHQPSFGMPGAKPVRCATHRSDGMVNLAAPKCISLGCRVVPSFAKPGARRASACSAHRRAGDVDIVTRRCHQEGCVHRPVFGDISTGKALYCSAHKLNGMMNVFAARCTALDCMELATFGIPGVKRPTHCTGHRDQQQHVRITSYHS